MPELLPATASDAEIIAFIDQWAGLLEQEKYAAALALTAAAPPWTPELLAEVIQAYGDAAGNRVTLHHDGTALDGAGNLEVARQRKEVDWSGTARGSIWYDLNINHRGSDLTATFDLKKRHGYLHIRLGDVHVM